MEEKLFPTLGLASTVRIMYRQAQAYIMPASSSDEEEGKLEQQVTCIPTKHTARLIILPPLCIGQDITDGGHIP